MSEAAVILRDLTAIGGPPKAFVSLKSLLLLLKLESQGHEVKTVNGVLMVTAKGKAFTRPQLKMLATHKRQLTSIVKYVEAIPSDRV